jgi:outer membrane protein OmpA-like peptidoglycan-associated protein
VGVNSSRLKIQGDGESQPAVSNNTEENRAQNRRVEIAIYANERMKSEATKEVGQ